MKELLVVIVDVFFVLGMELDNRFISSWKFFYIFLRIEMNVMLLNIVNFLEIVFILFRYWVVCFGGYKLKR